MKSNKQKCLEMWEWLAANPDKNKENYRNYLVNKGKAGEYSYCWACDEAYGKIDKKVNKNKLCEYCPMTWYSKQTKPYKNECMSSSSPYNTYYLNRDIKIRIKAAKQIIELIKDTWEE